jgi:hypothetical protein
LLDCLDQEQIRQSREKTNRPATTKGTTNDPPVIVSMTPANVVVRIPARFEAKFRIPPMEAT